MNAVRFEVNVLGVASVVLMLIGCVPEVETNPVTQVLEPADRRDYLVGDNFVYEVDRDGQIEIETTSIISVTDSTVTYLTEESGCRVSYYKEGYSPSIEWDSCGGPSGVRKLTKSGDLFPLKVGNSETWSGTGFSDDGRSGDYTRTCRVIGTARVTAPVGSFDTFHFQCTDIWRTRDFYFEPEMAVSVVWQSYNRRNNTNRRGSLVSFTRGG